MGCPCRLRAVPYGFGPPNDDQYSGYCLFAELLDKENSLTIVGDIFFVTMARLIFACIQAIILYQVRDFAVIAGCGEVPKGLDQEFQPTLRNSE